MRATLFALLMWLGLTLPVFAAETPQQDTGEVLGQIVSSHDVVAPGQEFHIAAYTILNEGWHTYWTNPGDSGEPFDLMLNLPGDLSAGEIIWPLPEGVFTGPILNYGFEGAPMFPVPMKVSDAATPGDVLEITGTAYYLVCKDVCIPESFDFTLPLNVGEPVIDDRWSRNIARAIKEAPKADDMDATAYMSGGKLIIDAPLTGDISKPYIYPYDPGTTLHSDPQNNVVGDDGIRAKISPGFNMDKGVTQPLKLLLGYDEVVDGKTVPRGKIIMAKPGAALDIGAIAAGTASGGNAGGGTSMTLLTAIIGAFIGGLILNLMPCVFPVISMKALSFARHAHDERSAIRRQGWLYTAGVLATFLALTVLLLVLKAGGDQIGWGFQLQSPWVTGLLALLVFTIGLNLIGAFEFAGGLQNVGSGLVSKGGASGSFFTGALAVIVATPCTAPFMAGAVGFALAQPAYVTIIVFMTLAIGFALPFLLLSYAPGLLAKLPKPGPWMERFKEILAFPMFGAAIWLVWVYSLQAGQTGLLKILIAMLLIGLGVWLLRRGTFGKVLAALAIIGAVLLPFNLGTPSELEKGVWSAETVQQLQANGQAVFVDFTAAWCVTCKVNELGALSSDKVIKAFNDTDTAFLVADWTNKDDVIAAELEKYGRSGVPLYLYFPADDNSVRGEILPQVLTVNMLLQTLQGTER